MKIGNLEIDEHGKLSMADIELPPEELERFEQIIAGMTRLAEASRRQVTMPTFIPTKCQWMGCNEPAKIENISLPGGALLKTWLCEKHTKKLNGLLHFTSTTNT